MLKLGHLLGNWIYAQHFEYHRVDCSTPLYMYMQVLYTPTGDVRVLLPHVEADQGPEVQGLGLGGHSGLR